MYGEILNSIDNNLTDDELDASLASFLWPIYIIAIPLGLLIHFIVEKIINKIKI